jgi:hypothetical protein
MTERRYLPTAADLIDRLSIVQLKAIFIPEYKIEYEKEIDAIMHDLFALGLNAVIIRAAMVVMLCNRVIWENESKARNGGGEQDKLLKFTHSINGVRNRAKNVISSDLGERVDLKTDCLAEELLKEFGNWNIWSQEKVSAHELEACGTQSPPE